MTPEQIIELAKEAGLHSSLILSIYGNMESLSNSETIELQRIQRFAALVESNTKADTTINEMQAVADAHAHRLAMYLELVCSDYGGKFWDMAMSVLSEYRADMNRIHERESPTFMGEPVIPKEVYK